MINVKIGIDLDGVLADFTFGFATQARRLGLSPAYNSNEQQLQYNGLCGLKMGDMEKVWKEIEKSRVFWSRLPSLIKPETWTRIKRACTLHDVYFITSRFCGQHLKLQTEVWLRSFGVRNPTVLLVPSPRAKAVIADRLHLDYVIDDSPEVLRAYKESTLINVYCRAWRYNVEIYNVRRVTCVGEMFDDINLLNACNNVTSTSEI